MTTPYRSNFINFPSPPILERAITKLKLEMDVEPRSSGGTPPHTSSSSYTFDYSTATYQSLGSSSRPINHDVQERLECVALSLEDETPPVRSLLCPAHWGALLESTTVSLVSTMREHAWESSDSSVILAQDLGESPKLLGQGEAESKSSSGDPISVLIDRGVYTPDSMSGTGDDSRTPQGGQSPQRYHQYICAKKSYSYACIPLYP